MQSRISFGRGLLSNSHYCRVGLPCISSRSQTSLLRLKIPTLKNLEITAIFKTMAIYEQHDGSIIFCGESASA
jgi:hypothetical protein